MFGWLHGAPPDPAFFRIAGVTVHWYGVILALALLVGILIAQRLVKRDGIAPEHVTDLALVATVAALIGARLVHVLNAWSYYRDHLVEALQIWRGGLAFHGVLLGGLLALWLYSRAKRIAPLRLLDVSFPALAAGQVIGRWGNWINQELYGTPTNVPWALTIDSAHRAPGYELVTTYHPIFLYESLGNALILTILLLVWRRPHRRLGDITATYLVLSPLLRFGLDFFRIQQPMIGPLTNAQVFSLILTAAGIVLFMTRSRRVTL